MNNIKNRKFTIEEIINIVNCKSVIADLKTYCNDKETLTENEIFDLPENVMDFQFKLFIIDKLQLTGVLKGFKNEYYYKNGFLKE